MDTSFPNFKFLLGSSNLMIGHKSWQLFSLKWQAHFIGFSFQVWIPSSGLSGVLSSWWRFMGEWLIQHTAPSAFLGDSHCRSAFCRLCTLAHRKSRRHVLKGCDWTPQMILLPKDIPECMLVKDAAQVYFVARDPFLPRCRRFHSPLHGANVNTVKRAKNVLH